MKKINIGLILAILLLGGLATTLLVNSNNLAYANTETTKSAKLSVAKPEQMNIFASRDNRAWGGVYMFNSNAKTGEPTYQPMTQSTGGHLIDYNTLSSLEKDVEYQKWNKVFGDGSFSSTDGNVIYHQSCAGCHLNKGQGGNGAGYYPPLANNPKMRSSEYIYSILINGFRGMPYFRDMLNDEQMAAVTKYIQEDLNGIKSTANAKDVTALRHETSPIIDPSDH